MNLTYQSTEQSIRHYTVKEIREAIAETKYYTKEQIADLRGLRKNELISAALEVVDELQQIEEARKQRESEERLRQLRKDQNDLNYTQTKQALLERVRKITVNAKDTVAKYKQQFMGASDLGYELDWHADKVHKAVAIIAQYRDLEAYLSVQNFEPTNTKDQFVEVLQQTFENSVEQLCSFNFCNNNGREMGRFQALQHFTKALRILMKAMYQDFEEYNQRVEYMGVIL